MCIGNTNQQPIGDLWNSQYLDSVMSYADGIGPDINFFTDLSVDYDMAITMMNQAHSKGLVVHPWEIRTEPNQVRVDDNHIYYKLSVDILKN
jgi:glycerophosphoryl diester phosphodiesterase